MDLKNYEMLMGVNLFKKCSFNKLLSVVWGVHRLLGVKKPLLQSVSRFLFVVVVVLSYNHFLSMVQWFVYLHILGRNREAWPTPFELSFIGMGLRIVQL